MTCRYLRGVPAVTAPGEGPAADAVATLLELALARRRDDFDWFAQSQGVPSERLEALWRGLLARLGADGPLQGRSPAASADGTAG